MKTVLIMAGGVGTRFWPVSRMDNPKQFLKLTDEDKTMLQCTVDRVKEMVDIERVFIATNDRYVDKIAGQLPDLPKENIIVEPCKRNTAPCIGLASLYINRKYPDSTMVVLPSDHVIKNNENFLNILESAANYVQKGDNIVTLGIKPNRPETGYGYIHLGKKVHTANENKIFKVKEFTEKPDYETAAKFYENGNYYWNSGMFIWKTKTILNKLKEHLPEIYKSLEKIAKAIGAEHEEDVIDEEFTCMTGISIDYGVLEKEEEIFVIPANFGWNDVGSWTALGEINKKDKNKNIVNVNSEYMGIDTKESIVYSEDKLVTTIGVTNLIIVNTEDAVLVCNKNNAQDVKKLRELLKEKGLEKYL
ncbi:MAG TPA: mannose-1-phosphate guanylyltransferase [Halanaerobiales bacterium]|nr:mannose-1-phosphate guanylyltransferase [Halanaerobiales bacterium]